MTFLAVLSFSTTMGNKNDKTGKMIVNHDGIQLEFGIF